jgi:ATP-dependent Clp protease ATP-binding subunit ClpX
VIERHRRTGNGLRRGAEEAAGLGELFNASDRRLLKFGMIPEFVGRLPVVATLEELSEEALYKILTEPKNAFVKQYQKLLELEGVTLRFSEGALRAVAQEAIKRKSGARGLRSILETRMPDIMYDIPSRDDVSEVVINEEVVRHGAEPMMVYDRAESA